MSDQQTPQESRTYRISTQISEEHGLLLERLQTQIRSECGKKSKICELLEMGIERLELDPSSSSKRLEKKQNNVLTQ